MTQIDLYRNGRVYSYIFRLIFLIALFNLPSLIYGKTDFFQPYILVGETGKDFEGTEEAIIQKFFMNDVEIIGKYRPLNDENRYILFVTTKQLKKASKNGGEYGLFLGVLYLALDVKDNMVYISIPNIDYWGNLFLRDDFKRVTKATGAFKTELLRLLPKLRGRFMRPFGASEPLSIDRLRNYKYMKRFPSRNEMIELGGFDNHDNAVRKIENKLSKSTTFTKLYRYDVITKNATLFGVQIPQEKKIAEILDNGNHKVTPFYPWQIAVVNGRIFAPAPLFKIPAGFPDISLHQILKIRKLAQSIEKMLYSLGNNSENS